jgi:hypothetical protein
MVRDRRVSIATVIAGVLLSVFLVALVYLHLQRDFQITAGGTNWHDVKTTPHVKYDPHAGMYIEEGASSPIVLEGPDYPPVLAKEPLPDDPGPAQ